MTRLSGTQYQQIQTALVEAFPGHAELAQLVRFALDANIHTIVAPGTLPDMVFGLLQHAEAHDSLPTLLARAVERNPGHRLLRAAAALVGLSLPNDFEAFSRDVVDPLESPSPAGEILEEVRLRFRDESQTLVQWTTALPTGRWIERPELHSLIDRIAGGEPRFAALLGAPGAGKSALLATLATRLIDQNLAVLAIKADLLPSEVHSLEDLRREIGLTRPLLDCIRLLAEQEKVVVIIDQLDALADRVDLRSERLNVVLKLIDRACAIENVFVVASCRRFECEHDARLARLRRSVVSLELPAHSAVDAELKEAGIEPRTIPPTMKEALRTPQTLNSFITRVHNGAESTQLSTYHALLESRWSDEVERARDGAPRVELLYRIATKMAEDEVLHLPRAQFSTSLAQVDSLASMGWLNVNGRNNARLSFSHQTLFDFVWARSYVERELESRMSLRDFVLARDPSGLRRQDAIFVRPRVWNVLQYLREADPTRYEEEFCGLWDEPSLRSHLRRLLVDFLGHASDPSRQETEWMRAALRDPQYVIQGWRAMRRQSSWFDALRSTEVLSAMVGDHIARNVVAWFLGSVVTQRRDQVIPLIESRWLNQTDEDLGRCASVLAELKSWNAAAVRFAIDLAARAPFNPYTTLSVAKSAAEHDTDRAARILGATIRSEADRRAAVMPPVTPLPSLEDVSEYYAAERSRREAEQPLRDLLLGHSQWYGLGEFALTAPEAFVRALFPVARQMVEVLVARREEKPPTKYVYVLELYLHAIESVDPETIWGALRAAIARTAIQSPDTWLHIVREHQDCSAAEIHGLLLLGLSKLPASALGEFVDYLRRDPRRWMIGTEISPLSETRQALESARRKLSEDQRSALVTMIRCWQADANARDSAKAELLSSFVDPEEADLLALAAIGAHDIRAARPLKNDGDAELHEICSPISVEQMKALDDLALETVAAELDDSTEWHHPRDWMKGGSIQFARELQLLAKDDPDRALRTVRQLDPTSHQRQIAHVVLALSELDARRTAVPDLVREFDVAGCSSEMFRSDATDALTKVARAQKGLDDATISLLAGWLTDASPERREQEHQRWTVSIGSSHAILSGGHVGPALPFGNRPILVAITAGLLLRATPAYERWLSILTEHLRRAEAPAVWEAIADDLRRVAKLPPERGEEFLSTLFRDYPSVLGDLRGIWLLLTTLRWARPSLTRQWMESLVESAEPWLWQAFGELLVLRRHVLPDDEWAREHIESELDAPQGERGARIRHGIAFASAQEWHEGREDTPLGKLLFRVLHLDDPAISTAIHFALRGDVALFQPTLIELLRALRDNPFHLDRAVGPALFNRMREVLDEHPDLVADLCEAMVAQTGAAVGDIRLAAHRHADHLVELSIQLQRHQAVRARGLNLFEKLLSFQVYEAETALFENDGVPRPR